MNYLKVFYKQRPSTHIYNTYTKLIFLQCDTNGC